MKKYTKLGLAVSVAGASALALAGYSSADSAHRALPDASIAQRVDVTSVNYPLESYRLDADQEKKIVQAIDELTVRCMKDFGITYKPVPSTGDGGLESSHKHLYGVTDEEEARKYGYGNPDLGKEIEKQSTGETSEELAVRIGEVSTYNGKAVPENGCQGQASKQVFREQSPEQSEAFTDELILQASAQTQRDPRVREVFQKWNACMKKKGFTYSTPLEALDDSEFASPSATKHEKNVAVADAQCKKKNNVTGVWSSVEMAYQNQAIGDNSARLASVRASLQKNLQSAARINK
ncbi:hypothetical protein ADK86_26285 [Streptomyces sp. NRRL F-5755]|uniref:hypothetical protein n=1 Tax=Streptomyces sp. NRRL F-5755 TaxID=1519475 RepID=UPI0006B0101F|nr:hypothetical protein [Streptomyces sp. NRRL F-5755]KOT90409.1 hypothetical protein ADK86_26285 [Streptomyces sp. NRRL F-5755]